MTIGASTPLLELRGVSFAYDGAIAVDAVSLLVRSGEAVALLGSNGAGKSTTVKISAGVLRPQAGSTWFEGAETSQLPSHSVVEQGITLVPKGDLCFLA
jgi:branched-chain amino acid transport system ATP-binding protein